MAGFRTATAETMTGHGEAFGKEGHCPLCEQAIPHEQSEAVRQRIAAGELDQALKIEQRLAAGIAAAELKSKAAIEAAQKCADAAVAVARNEIAAARAEAARMAEDKMAARLAELESARVAAEQRITALRAGQDAREQERLAAQREQLERDKIAAVQAAETKAFEDKQKLQGKMADLQRQLENKTAQDLGYGPEVDLFELLKGEFPEDRITRVEKGAAGADVVHDVYHNGRSCGRIVYDSKNSSAWRNDYVSKLRADQSEAKADHAVLCTKSFPSGVKELHTMDGVLVVSPQRVGVIASLLRRHVVQTATLRLSNEARSQKTAALYSFIMSDQCGQLLSSIAVNSEDMTELDAKERKTHEALWKKRADLIRSVQRAHGDLSFEIERIIGVSGNRPDRGNDEASEAGDGA
ncbi:MAG: DUF2130 domain-containing protein [Hyphomicrobium sp.]